MSQLLASIKEPSDVKTLNEAELTLLAQELREKIIQTVARNGGHLASNLGVIEATIALAKVFDFPQDKIVWDVGHQSYAYKLLSGRQKEFESLRLWEGMPGFPKREESQFDAFNTGHSSTSISAALGILRAQRSKGNHSHVIAFIGDGALTGGMSFEALNDVGSGDENLIIVINDNQMSISENVGGLNNHFNHLRTSGSYLDIKNNVSKFLQGIPLVGGALANGIATLKRFMRRRASDQHNVLYEALGFKYYGPVDGHNLEDVENVLEAAKRNEGPVVVHLVTTKGKGYEPAVDMPENYHGVAPFVVENGVVAKAAASLTAKDFENPMEYLRSVKNFGEAFSYSLQYFASKNPNVVGICAAMAGGTNMRAFSEKYPERFYDVGIAEQHAVTLAAGMTVGGLRPVVGLYSTFLQRALDQVMHDVVLQNLPVIFCLDRAGIVGEDGETHQGVYELPFLRAVPKGYIFTPRDAESLFQAISFAFEVDDQAVFIRYPKGNSLLSEDSREEIISYLKQSDQYDLPVTEAQILKEGPTMNIIAWGYATGLAYEAAKLLESDGMDVSVIDLREIKTLNPQFLKKILTKPSLIVEEAIYPGSVAEEILAFAKANAIDQIIESLHIKNDFILQGKRDTVLEAIGISTDNIVSYCKSIVQDTGGKV